MSEDPFVVHRSLLFTVAYEMLGSVADAEDVVQETWLRWAALVEAERCEVRDPRAYLVRIVTRLCLNRLTVEVDRSHVFISLNLLEFSCQALLGLLQVVGRANGIYSTSPTRRRSRTRSASIRWTSS